MRTLLYAAAAALAVSAIVPTVAQAQSFDGNYSGVISVKTDNHMGRQPCGFVDNNRTLAIQGGKIVNFIFISLSG
jgi:hypothetical protein